MPRGRKPKIPHDELFHIVKKYKILDNAKNALPIDNPIWNTIFLEEIIFAEKDYQLESLYNHVRQNRHGIIDKLSKFYLGQLTQEKDKDDISVQNEQKINEKIEEVCDTDEDDCLYEHRDDLALYALKSDPSYIMSIREISLYPFEVLLWSPDQLDFLKDLQKGDLTISLKIEFFICENVEEFNIHLNGSDPYKSKQLSLLSLLVEVENCIIPLANLISESNNTISIEHFYYEWSRSLNKCFIPKAISVPSIRFIADSICFIFNNCSLRDYVANIYQLCRKKKSGEPKCLICMDIVGIMIYLKGKCLFDDVQKEKFYMQCILLLSDSNDIARFEELLEDLLIISSSPGENQFIKELRNKLDSEIGDKPFHLLEKYNNEEFDYAQSLFLSTESWDNDVIHYINDISEKSSQKIVKFFASVKVNSLYCPEFFDGIKKICPFFLCWTKIMLRKSSIIIPNPFYSDEYSKLFKANAFKSIKNFIRAILDHSSEIMEGAHFSKIRNSLNEKPKKKKKINKELDSVFDDFLNNKENWKGRALMENSIQDVMGMDVEIEDIESFANKYDVPDIKHQIQPNQIETGVEHITAIADYQESIGVLMHQDQLSQMKARPEFLDTTADYQRSFGVPINVNEFSNVDHRSRTLIQNGLLRPNIIIPDFRKDKLVKIINTCPFDSIFELLVSAWIDYPAFRDTLMNSCDKKDCNVFGECILNIVEQYISSGFDKELFYILRANILYRIYGKTLSSSEVLDCCANAGSLLFNLLSRGHASRIISTACECGYTNSYTTSTFILDEDFILNNADLKNLQFCCQNYFMNSNYVSCYNKKCKAYIKQVVELKSYIFVDVEYVFQTHADLRSNLFKLPNSVIVDNKILELVGLVSFPYSGHYVCYLKQNGQWQLWDDMKDKAVNITENCTIRLAGLLYVMTAD